MPDAATSGASNRPVAIIRCILSSFERIPVWMVSTLARFGMAGVFFRSGQTKVENWEITSGAHFLFREEYKLPLLPPELAAMLAAFAEHAFSILLIVGLASRLSALGLLGVTAVIQIFVYPNLWADHATWAAALLIVIVTGPGPLSLDHLIHKRMG